MHIFFQAAVQLILLVPLITMRQFAEERRSGTLELLLTAPLREIDIVVAKFIACMVVVLAMTSLTLVYAVVLAVYGDPDWGPIYSGYLGLIMFGAALIAIGLMISALTANQIVAAVVSLGLFGILWAIDTLASLAAAPVRELAARSVAAGAFHALRGRRHVFVRLRLLPHCDPARPVPDRPGAGAALSDARSMRSIWRRCCGRSGWLVAVLVLFALGAAAAAARAASAVHRAGLYAARLRRCRARRVGAGQPRNRAQRHPHRPDAREGLHAVGRRHGGRRRAENARCASPISTAPRIRSAGAPATSWR